MPGMDILQAALSNLRTRSHTSTDEWIVPYTGRVSPPPRQASGKPLWRASVKSASYSNLFNVTCGGSLVHTGERVKKRQVNGYTHATACGARGLHPKHKKSASMTATSSQNSPLLPAQADRFPSYTSVTTGLREPNILFSPLNRQLRAQAGNYENISPQTNNISFGVLSDDSETRRRTVSAPYYPSSHLEIPYQNMEASKQWHVPSARELYISPRPLLFSQSADSRQPPDSRSSVYSNTSTDSQSVRKHVLEVQEARQLERENWATIMQRRDRSLSLGGRAKPPLDTMPVGNARARERERSKSRDKSTDRPMTNLVGGIQGGKRSLSFIHRWGRPSHDSSSSGFEGSSNDGKGALFNHTRTKSADEVPSSFAFARPSAMCREGLPSRNFGSFDPDLYNGNYKPVSTLQTNIYSRGYTRSHPNLRTLTEGNFIKKESRQHPMARSPGKTLQFKQPSTTSRGGVVVISRVASNRWATTTARTKQITSPLDISKPLPDLPLEANSLTDLDGMPVPPSIHSISSTVNQTFGYLDATEISQDSQEKNIQAVSVDGKSENIISCVGIESTGFPIVQPQVKKQVFNSSNARIFLAKQQQRARMQRAFKFPVQSPPGYWQPVTKNSFVDSSVGDSSNATHLSCRPADDSSEILPQTPITAPPHYVTRDTIQLCRCPGTIGTQKSEKNFSRSSTTIERLMSGVHVGSNSSSSNSSPFQPLDNCCGDSFGRRGETPSAIQDNDDFHGLFFQTPHDLIPTPDIPMELDHPLVPRVQSPKHSEESLHILHRIDASEPISPEDYQIIYLSGGSDGTVINTPDAILSDDPKVDSERSNITYRPEEVKQKMPNPVKFEIPIKSNSSRKIRPTRNSAEKGLRLNGPSES
ncbi:uncharacterized protein L203_100434 [Cryptococcus depauperatus CBS 7841]|uniref:Uncharacterized protein n=1 Tax=Cryptococcus depauperatus CBS 7841 TaxID=1295531 RepID=A0A1E3HYE6_9TREE|nr:hypothetical protein L203_05691 [Cryptococcus depauperatus CBS 7841]